MMEAEFAYFDGEIKGNSKVAVSYLGAVKDFIVESNISELAFSSNGFSGVLLKEPILIFVRVKGDISDAKLCTRKILKEFGFVKSGNLESILEFAEEIDKLPIEEVLKRMKR
ncbi:hypothetical protein [Archaeoglobus sp.]